MKLVSVVGIAALLVASDMRVASAAPPESPFRWVPPPTFSARKPGLGLPQLEGVTHYVIYDAIPSKANVSEGGSGQYESLRHGTYNHHTRIALFKDKLIVYWTNHSRDENGPGQRVLGKVGTFSADRTEIDWGGDETFVELAPPLMPVSRRQPRHDPGVVPGGFVNVKLDVINGRLYVRGRTWTCHGWANEVKYHGRRYEPIPAEHWSHVHSRKRGHRWDAYWPLGMRFLQRWHVRDRTLVPDSPLYKKSDLVTRVEISPGRFARVPPPNPPYANTLHLSKAPLELQEDVVHGKPEGTQRYPKYAKGTFRLAADGENGLAHHTEFRRPDGKWVVIRDNLVNPGYYYAALKEKREHNYPPAVRTNLYGGVMPVAGELPDSRPWIICNSPRRTDMYLTLSDDGITFDRTWLLLHIDRRGDPGFSKANRGGPQYFHAVTVGPNMWVAYSIAQTQVGVTKIPIRLLNGRPRTGKPRPTSRRSAKPASPDDDVRFVAPVPDKDAQTMWTRVSDLPRPCTDAAFSERTRRGCRVSSGRWSARRP